MKVIKKHKKIDYLINCAGVSSSKQIQDVTQLDYSFIFDNNIKSALDLASGYTLTLAAGVSGNASDYSVAYNSTYSDGGYLVFTNSAIRNFITAVRYDDLTADSNIYTLTADVDIPTDFALLGDDANLTSVGAVKSDRTRFAFT